jgi:hypothetical protein
MSTRLRTGLLVLAPALVLAGCFGRDPEPVDPGIDPLAPVSITGSSLTGGLSASGEEIRPSSVSRFATGTVVQFSDDRRLVLTRTGVVALKSGYKIVGNGEVVGADGNQIGYMAPGDKLVVDEAGKIDWIKAQSGSTATGSSSSGASATGVSATGTILSATGKLSATGTLHAPMLDPESGAIGPDSDDSH